MYVASTGTVAVVLLTAVVAAVSVPDGSRITATPPAQPGLVEAPRPSGSNATAGSHNFSFTPEDYARVRMEMGLSKPKDWPRARGWHWRYRFGSGSHKPSSCYHTCAEQRVEHWRPSMEPTPSHLPIVPRSNLARLGRRWEDAFADQRAWVSLLAREGNGRFDRGEDRSRALEKLATNFGEGNLPG